MLEIIAFYLPQFHPTKDNNEWWGKGFTEWTNVAKAKKLYPGHYQPKIPGELGFYDLRIPEVRKEQALLAKEAGVTAFCYYHYWFGNGKQELERPFNEVVDSGEPDFPFCLCWANESWFSKLWNKDGTSNKKLLIEQVYPGKLDNEKHFYSLLNAFRDKRYLRIDGRVVFMIYHPDSFIDFDSFKKQWNDLAEKNGLPHFYFIGQVYDGYNVDKTLREGYDAVNLLHFLHLPLHGQTRRKISYKIKSLLKIPFIIPYKRTIKNYLTSEDYRDDVFPSMMPNWDHTPRSTYGGAVLHGSTPELFQKHAETVLGCTQKKKPDSQVIFLKSWNEWGEGNYMEPDLRFGRGYIEALKKAINNVFGV